MNRHIARVVVLLIAFGSIVAAPARAQTAEACAGTTSSLTDWGSAQVAPDGLGNNLRSAPSASADLVAQIPPGDYLYAMDQTVCAEGYLWRHVNYNGMDGWTPESKGNDLYLLPFHDPPREEVGRITLEGMVVVSTADLQLDFDPSLARSITRHPEYGFSVPGVITSQLSVTRYRFPNYVGSDTIPAYDRVGPSILLIRLDGYARIMTDAMAENIDRLWTMIHEREPLPTMEGQLADVHPRDELPMAFGPPGFQMFDLHAEYLNFKNGAGIRYLTAYSQQFVEVQPHSLFYTFQGLTEDKEVYISAAFPVDVPDVAYPLYRDDRANEGFNPDYAAYFDALLANVNRLADDAFTPDLHLLDDLIRSMHVEPAS